MKLLRFILLALVLYSNTAVSQKSLRATIVRFGKVKVYEAFTGELLEYKLKGDVFYKKKVIASLTDSLVVFTNDSVITISKIKAIRFRKRNHLVSTFQAAFMGFGIGFVPLSALNNVITDNSPVFNEKAAYVAASVFAAGIVMRQINIKHFRVSKNRVLQVVDINYNNLNQKAVPETSSP